MHLPVLLANLPYLLIGAFPDGPLGGTALTLVLALSSALLSAVLGLAGGIALALTRGVAHVVLLATIGFFRAIPVLMLIFWTFFLLPILLHIDVPGLATVVCAAAPIYRIRSTPGSSQSVTVNGKPRSRWASRAHKHCGMWCCHRPFASWRRHLSINGCRSSKIPRWRISSACRSYRFWQTK